MPQVHSEVVAETGGGEAQVTTTQSELDELRARYSALEREKNHSDTRLAYVMTIAETQQAQLKALKARCEELGRHMMRYRRHPSYAVSEG